VQCSDGQAATEPWQLAGKPDKICVQKDEPLSLALKAVDYQNHKGYFDIVIEVPDASTVWLHTTSPAGRESMDCVSHSVLNVSPFSVRL
jgi:hypothetical protein